MALSFTLQYSSHFCSSKTALSEKRLNTNTSLPHLIKINTVLRNQLQFRHASTSAFQRGALPPTSSSSLVAGPSQSLSEENSQSNKTLPNEMKFNRVNCLVWILHESSRSFSVAMKDSGLDRTGPPLSMAWIGVDVNAWHKHISYQVAVYALLIAVTEVELLLSHNRSNNPSPVLNVLSPTANFLGDLIESQLNTRNPKLVQWFRTEELPEMSGSFMTLFKKWAMEYAGSGVAGTVMAMTCCAAIRKLGSERISCSLFSNSNEDALFELMDATNSLVSLCKLHHLASEAGFEEEFLSYFGSKILPHKNVEDVEFWMCLVQRKLSTAFHRESVTNRTRVLSNKVEEDSLATLALFAYLGRETRLFLSRHGIRVLDKQTRDFVSFLECGILFIYPEFSTLSEYHLLMEVILDEIGWLNFYAAYNNQLRQERRRSKHPPIHAEKEITLHAVFTVCYDVILGYAHCSNSSHQALGTDLINFLLKSQALLTTCLEDYWMAYDGTIEMQRIGEKNELDLMPSIWMKDDKSSFVVDTWYNRPAEMNKIELHIQEHQATSTSSFQASPFLNFGHPFKSKPFRRNFLRKYTRDLVASIIDVWMGTQLLFVDISYTMRLVQKKLNGHKVTKREKRKIHRTTSDLFTLIPVAILMLLPVSAVGHAAMFAAIKKYIPNLIPSPYSDERLDLVKQLKRIKKMKVRLIGIEESAASKGVK